MEKWQQVLLWIFGLMLVEFLPVFLYYCIKLYKEMNEMCENKKPQPTTEQKATEKSDPKQQKRVVNESFSYEDVEQDIDFIDQFLGDQDGDDDN